MKKVLFVYVENACRSQVAEAFFNKLANGEAIATSTGTKPSKEVNPKVVVAMKEEFRGIREEVKRRVERLIEELGLR